MNLPPIHNKRSPEQWEIISKHVDFEGKTVLDLGCGYGDILFRCLETGAKYTLGLDKLFGEVEHQRSSGLGFAWMYCDIEQLPRYENFDTNYDIVICFSVLPYLENRLDVLKWIKDHSEIALLEIQYWGDGPGLASIQNDDDAKAMLKYIGWQSVEAIGRTLVKDRQKYRTIWCCK